MDMPTSFISIILFDEDFKYGNGTKFWGYAGTNTEPLFVKFCNFVQCLALVNNLTFCLSVCLPIITF
jgi:hypothetical protein